MYILSQNTAEDLWHSDSSKSISQPLLQRSHKDRPQHDPVLIRIIISWDSNRWSQGRLEWNGCNNKYRVATMCQLPTKVWHDKGTHFYCPRFILLLPMAILMVITASLHLQIKTTLCDWSPKWNNNYPKVGRMSLGQITFYFFLPFFPLFFSFSWVFFYELKERFKGKNNEECSKNFVEEPSCA